jgi:hypothetical protein
MTKGVLVLIMVAYHTLNYSTQYYLGFRYFSFLPPSFIIITGFLISAVYSARYHGSDSRTFLRLIIRGCKLALLFTLLNVAAHLVGRNSHVGRPIGLSSFFEHAYEIYILGAGRYATFEVLLPIAYLLLIAPLLIWAEFQHRLVLPIASLALLTLCVIIEECGVSSANLNLIGAGVVGMVAGRIPLHTLQVLGRFLLVTLLAYGGCLLLGALVGQTYLVQLLAASIALAAIYGGCVRIGDHGWIQRRLIRLGRYSLVSYIIQIGILQILARFVGRPAPWSIGSAELFLGTVVLMTATVDLIECARNRSLGVEKLYRAVFA